MNYWLDLFTGTTWDELLFLHESADAMFQDMDKQEARFQTIADTGNAQGRLSRQDKI